MYSGRYVFAQVLKFVSKYEFDRCVNHYFGNYRVSFTFLRTSSNYQLSLCAAGRLL
jgi:hypothetical protein